MTREINNFSVGKLKVSKYIALIISSKGGQINPFLNFSSSFNYSFNNVVYAAHQY